jgi:molybdopterin converting factor small subunit
MAFAAVGAGIALLGSETLLGGSGSLFAGAGRGKTSASSATATTTASSSTTTLRVKAVYFQMPQLVGIEEEYFVLEGPARLSDLLKNVTQRHPPLSDKMSAMMILIDGVPTKSNDPLKDGDEVDFIPTFAGG